MAVDLLSRELRIVGHDNDTVLDLQQIKGLSAKDSTWRWAITAGACWNSTTAISRCCPCRKVSIRSFGILVSRACYVCPAHGGKVLFAPLRIQVHPAITANLIWYCATRTILATKMLSGSARTLVVEIVSPDDPERDTKVKRADYAEAGIPDILDH